jgi:hypothetical protein
MLQCGIGYTRISAERKLIRKKIGTRAEATEQIDKVKYIRCKELTPFSCPHLPNLPDWQPANWIASAPEYPSPRGQGWCRY